ncbi:MAG: glycosyltransferase family 2 protein [Microbacteriaceae bacterium]|nr:glycosyltransferase family 2 protein [Microbacteriaceae bacterium]
MTAKPDQTKKPAVSVLVPIYNVEQYLEKCLESLKNQTFQDAEFLCINDGSTDGSKAIIERFIATDPRFKLIDKPNSGYGASMNRGLKEAAGDYIAILESDDFMVPNALAELYATAIAQEADVVKANFYFYWSQPAERSERFEVVPAGLAGKVVQPQGVADIFYAKPSIWSAMYSRAFLAEKGIDFLETPGASFQDLSFTFKVYAEAERAAFIDTPIVHYRQDNENSSVNSPGKVEAVFVEYDEISAWLKKHPNPELETIKTKMLYDAVIWNYERVAPEYKTEVLSRAADVFEREQADGHIDVRLFEPWKLAGLRTILLDPEEYHKQRLTEASPKAKLTRVLHERGPVGAATLVARKVVKAIAKKLGR